MSDVLHIGCGAGFSGDRWDAAVPVVRALRAGGAGGAKSVLIFETLAERTLALAQLKRRQDPDSGWEPTLERFLAPVLRDCVEARIPIVGNFGAANPAGAAARIHALAARSGVRSLKVAVVEGDDLLVALPSARMHELLPPALQGTPLVSANAYLGAQEIAQALQAGADVVVTGRVADPALALGPMLAHFGWKMDDWDRLARGTMAGHLLECGAQVTGGYFADPGVKDVPGLAEVGFPIVEMEVDGSFVVTKPAGTGGRVDRQTVVEQLLYELHDPAAYLTPDVVADIADADVDQVGADRVRVTGVRGHARPPTLKATLCYEGGWLAEGEISYAGPNAPARAKLAASIVRDRLRILGHEKLKLRADLIGVASVLADDAGRWWQGHGAPASDDVRLRMAAACESRDEADTMLREVLALYTCGPAGGGGVRTAGDTAPRERFVLRAARVAATAVELSMTTVALHALAHARTGDKGDRSSISVIAYEAQHWTALVGQVTEARVAELFAHRRPTSVRRYLLPKLHAMNFVLDGVLDGGVNGSLNLDTHGKCLSSLLLQLPIQLDDTNDTKETP